MVWCGGDDESWWYGVAVMMSCGGGDESVGGEKV